MYAQTVLQEKIIKSDLSVTGHMTTCDLCGKHTPLYLALVEGTQLAVCEHCTTYGTFVKKIIPTTTTTRKFTSQKNEAPEEVITNNYSKLIHASREQQQLTQEDFAKKLNIKPSFLQKIEQGTITPSITLARQLEKTLHIKLVEQTMPEGYASPHLKSKKIQTDTFTIGDIIKTK